MKEVENEIVEDMSNKPDFDEKEALIYGTTEFLTKIGLWNDDVKNKIRSYNTENNFTYRRYLQMRNNYLAYSFLYIILKYQIEYPKGIDGDPLVIQDVCLSKGIEYADVDYFLRSNRRPTVEFVKYLWENNGLDSSMIEDPEYFDKLLDIDDFKCDVDKVVNRDAQTKYKFLKKVDYNKWGEYKELLTDDFIISYLGCFKISDLLFIRTKEQIYSLVGKAPYQERYKMYNKFELNVEVIGETRKELKSLVKSNITAKVDKFKKLSGINPLSVIYEVIDQIVCFPPLIPLVAEIIKQMDEMIKDIFVFYIIKYIQDKKTFVNEDCFAKWFVNLSALIRNIYSSVTSIPIIDMIKDLLSRKRYSCVLLLESIDVPKDILSGLGKAYKRVFVYEDYDLKLKMDVSDKYSILTRRRFTLKPTLSNYKFMTPFEIKAVQKDQLSDIVNLIEEMTHLEDDYFAIRNLALLIGSFVEELKPYHKKLYDLFIRLSEDKEEDIRVLCSSLVSKLTFYLRDDPNFKSNMKREELKEECGLLKKECGPIKEDVEVGEIVEPKRVKKSTTPQPISKPTKRIRERYLYDRFGKRIVDPIRYYKRGLPKDFYYPDNQ